MKPCAENRQQIVWLSLNTLTAQEATDLKAHLQTCDVCRGYQADIARVTATLRITDPEVEIQDSEAFHQRLNGILRARESRSRWVFPLPSWRGIRLNWRVALSMFGAMALALVLGLSWIWLSHGPLPAASPDRPVAQYQSDLDLMPTFGNYQAVAERSLDQFDELLTRQGNRSVPSFPIYSASMIALDNVPD